MADNGLYIYVYAWPRNELLSKIFPRPFTPNSSRPLSYMPSSANWCSVQVHFMNIYARHRFFIYVCVADQLY